MGEGIPTHNDTWEHGRMRLIQESEFLIHESATYKHLWDRTQRVPDNTPRTHEHARYIHTQRRPRRGDPGRKTQNNSAAKPIFWVKKGSYGSGRNLLAMSASEYGRAGRGGLRDEVS